MSQTKKLLTIDGGGIRGVIAAEILVKIEQALKDYNPKWQCLADYFDFVAGTSTGALVAASLAKGMSAQEIVDIYRQYGKELFTKNWTAFIPIVRKLYHQYNPKNLEKRMSAIFGETTLDTLKTHLLIVTKNTTVGENYFFASHPDSRFYRQNSKILIRDLLRASSAAPTYFPPHVFQVNGQTHEFVDGGISMFNNPALLLFLETTEPQYRIAWTRQARQLLLVSIGTGYSFPRISQGQAKHYNNIDWARYVTKTLMSDASYGQNRLLELMSYCPQSWEGDRVIFKPITQAEDQALNHKWLTYYRLTTPLNSKGLKQLNIQDKGIDLAAIKEMDCVDHIEQLREIGQAIAEKQFSIDCLAGFLDEV